MSVSDMKNHALRLSDMLEEPGRMLLPIQGYEKMPLVTLEEAVKPLISIVTEVEEKVRIVKYYCTKPPDDLLPDESASIMLYSMEWVPRQNSLYMILNDTLRLENRDLLQPWFLYLKLFITALSKIPSKHLSLHRGVKKDLSANYHQGQIVVWWGFSSCTSSIDVLNNGAFFSKTGVRTLFTIDCHSGKDIHQHSLIKTENEVLLLAARQFNVNSSLNSGNDLHIIHLEEVDSSPPLLAPLPTGIAFPPPKSSLSIPPMKQQNLPPYKNEMLEQIISKCQSRKLNLSKERLDNDQDMEIVVKQGIIGKQCIILDLKTSAVTQGGVSILALALSNNTCLEELNISYNNISDSSIRLLTSAINSSILKRINLEGNDISDEGAKYLAELLETNTNLLQLSLSVNQISSHGVIMLANALARDNTRLESLNLSANTDVNDESVNSVVNMIEHNRSLKKLDLRHCDLSEDGKARLRAIAKSKRGFDLWLSNSM
jgi:hypothetical protein